MITWTATQRSRLRELHADDPLLEMTFVEQAERDRAFHETEKRLVRRARSRLRQFRDGRRRPLLCRLQEALAEVLVAEGFVQVVTPTLMSRGLLAKMGITDAHPLSSQIYWVDGDKCLRPMLAPHLYFVLKDLLRLWDRPVRIFEIGSCFRKETQGSLHSSEFTMLNLVEMGLPLEERRNRFESLTRLVMDAAGISDYRVQTVPSEIYEETIDIEAGDPPVEVASAAFGPHSLDHAWRIHESWVGIGFGLERLIMVAEGLPNLGGAGRSLVYLDGIRLNI